MELFSGILTVMGIHIPAMIVPGMVFALITQTSLSNGRTAGFWLSIGCVLGTAFHLSYSMFGVAWAVQQYPEALTFLRLFGGLFFLYLAWQIWHKPISKSNEEVSTSNRQHSPQLYIKRGILTQMVNPEPAMFFIAIFTAVVTPMTPLWHKITYGGVVLMNDLIWFLALTFIFSNTRLRSRFLRHEKLLLKVISLIILFFGMRMLLSAFAL